MGEGSLGVGEHTLLVRSSRLVSARDVAGRLGVLNVSIGHPLALNEEGWRFLDLFRTPTTPRAVAAQVGADKLPRVLEIVAAFVSHGLLVEPDEEAYLYAHGRRLRAAGARSLAAPAEGLFHARAQKDAADFAVLGVPFDRGARSSGAAFGPAGLRRASTFVPAGGEPQSDRSPGIWDAATGTWRLRGARFADLGDAVLSAEDSLEEAYGRICHTLEAALRGTTALPIVLGGDHSITYPVIRALASDPCFLVHFDAHSDLGDYGAGGPHHHGNVVSRLLRESRVQAVLQCGVRDVAPSWRPQDERIEQLGAYRLRGLSPADVVARVPEDAACYVTIDIDVLDPSCAPATGHPLPGGLDLPALEAILETLALERRLVGADLVEVAPDAPGGVVTQVSALRLLMRLCDGYLRNGRRRRPA